MAKLSGAILRRLHTTGGPGQVSMWYRVACFVCRGNPLGIVTSVNCSNNLWYLVSPVIVFTQGRSHRTQRPVVCKLITW